jgi:hypothetical protein
MKRARGWLPPPSPPATARTPLLPLTHYASGLAWIVTPLSVIFSSGRSRASTFTFSIASSVSSPWITFPNTVYLRVDPPPAISTPTEVSASTRSEILSQLAS